MWEVTAHLALVGVGTYSTCRGLMVASSWPMKFDGNIDAVISGCWLADVEALPVCCVLALVLELAFR